MATLPEHLRSVEAALGRAVERLYRWLSHNRVTRFPWAVIQTFSEAQGALLSGSMAYYTFLSLLPLIMVAGFVVGTVSSRNFDVQLALADAVDQIFPGQKGLEVLSQLIDARIAFGVFGFVAVAYAGSGFVGALTACLNQMWGVPSGRNPFGQKLINLMVVIMLGLVLLGSAALTLWVSYLAAQIFNEGADPFVRVLEVVVSPLSLLLLLLLLYRLLPAKHLSWRSHLPGAIFGTVGIELLKRAFALWAEYSAGVSALPRSLVSVVLLLVWLGFFGQLILYGAALNVVWDRRRRGQPLMPQGQETSGVAV
jgi:membrane protein